MTTDHVEALVFALRFIQVRAAKLSDGISANQVFHAHWKAAYHREAKRVFGKEEAEIIAALEDADRIYAEASVSNGISRVREEDILALAEASAPIRAKAILSRKAAAPAHRASRRSALMLALMGFKRMHEEASDEAVRKARSILRDDLNSGEFDVLPSIGQVAHVQPRRGRNGGFDVDIYIDGRTEPLPGDKVVVALRIEARDEAAEEEMPAPSAPVPRPRQDDTTAQLVEKTVLDIRAEFGRLKRMDELKKANEKLEKKLGRKNPVTLGTLKRVRSNLKHKPVIDP